MHRHAGIVLGSSFPVFQCSQIRSNWPQWSARQYKRCLHRLLRSDCSPQFRRHSYTVVKNYNVIFSYVRSWEDLLLWIRKVETVVGWWLAFYNLRCGGRLATTEQKNFVFLTRQTPAEVVVSHLSKMDWGERDYLIPNDLLTGFFGRVWGPPTANNAWT